MNLKPGDRITPYEIVGLLGSGGMGEVYRARDARLGRDVAIKVLPAAFAGDSDRLGRFEQEARAAAALNHPNILAVYDVGQHPSTLSTSSGQAGSGQASPYIVTELLEGETLRDRLAGGALLVRKAVEYAVQVAKGLAAAHDKGIVHRDLKPENIFVTADDRVKILDFGLAKLTQPDPALRELFYRDQNNRVMAVPIAVSGTTLKAGAPVTLFTASSGFVASPDGQRFLVSTVTADPAPITLLLNWAGLRRR